MRDLCPGRGNQMVKNLRGDLTLFLRQCLHRLIQVCGYNALHTIQTHERALAEFAGFPFALHFPDAGHHQLQISGFNGCIVTGSRMRRCMVAHALSGRILPISGSDAECAACYRTESESAPRIDRAWRFHLPESTRACSRAAKDR